MVLTKYPAALVEWATDPRTGIQATEQFKTYPPNSGEVKAFCDTELARIVQAERDHRNPSPKYRPREYVPPERYPGSWARVFVGTASPNYAAAEAWAKAPHRDEREFIFKSSEPKFDGAAGVWVTWNGWCDEIKSAAVRGWKRPTLDEQYAAVGQAEADYQKQVRAETAP